MITIHGRNLTFNYVKGLHTLHGYHTLEASRNGPVLVLPEALSTHYVKPCERVHFDAQRDANPFFHLVEALWMLDGRHQLDPLTYYVPRMKDFSDDGRTFHGAYGYRWRQHWPMDQIDKVIAMLRADRTTRRAVVSMWDPDSDLAIASKDIPCNLTITFQCAHGMLNMVVFNRSNDAILGHYGANVVHFSMLQEYIASMCNMEVGWYEQVTANFHAYESAWNKYWPIVDMTPVNLYDAPFPHRVTPLKMVSDLDTFDKELGICMDELVAVRHLSATDSMHFENRFFFMVVTPMTEAYRSYRTFEDVQQGIDTLDRAIAKHGNIDWLVAGRQWLLRRLARRNAIVEAGQ